MARETKVVQGYPSDSAVKQAIRELEQFGWDLTSNQKITDKTGSYEGADGNYYTTTETYRELTFSREKSSPWYKKIVELEQEYYALDAQYNRILASEPRKPKYISFFGVILVFTPLLPITLPLLIFNIIRQSKGKKKYKIAYDEWFSKKSDFARERMEKQEAIAQKASDLLSE